MDTRSVVPDTKEIQRVAFASAIGCVIEWYDFFLYGVIAGYIVLVSIVSLVSVALLGDRTGKDLAEIDQMGARVVPVVPAAA